MADDNKLTAETRTQFGKGAARRIRAANKIPAVLYGHGTDPVHLTLPGHETMLLIRKANALIDLELESGSQVALVKDVQKDPVHQVIEHIDLVVIRRGEKVTVNVAVHLEGETASGTVANLDATSLELEVEATSIPENLVVSVEGLEAGSQIHASDVPLPEGAKLITDPDVLVVNVTVPAMAPAEDEAAEGEEAAAGEEPTEESPAEDEAAAE